LKIPAGAQVTVINHLGANVLEVHDDGSLVAPHLPTAAPVASGSLWNNAGVVNIVP
jgi:hypothetical protein